MRKGSTKNPIINQLLLPLADQFQSWLLSNKNIHIKDPSSVARPFTTYWYNDDKEIRLSCKFWFIPTTWATLHSSRSKELNPINLDPVDQLWFTSVLPINCSALNFLLLRSKIIVQILILFLWIHILTCFETVICHSTSLTARFPKKIHPSKSYFGF